MSRLVLRRRRRSVHLILVEEPLAVLLFHRAGDEYRGARGLLAIAVGCPLAAFTLDFQGSHVAVHASACAIMSTHRRGGYAFNQDCVALAAGC